ncbi:MAG TPA: tagaturonate epimerase family protein [Lacipirellulaceae bacterium]|nr:tagaturonate epimerase family protein [Lacipirellulaceae bacterium]
MNTALAPTVLGMEPSFGFGDRLGLATPGHIAALREAGGSIRGIFAQQSIREMTRTKRTAPAVMQAAVDALTAAKFTQPWGADADHLKTPEDIRYTADAGFVFFTLDPSDDVDQQADGYDAATLADKFAAIRDFAPWVGEYQGRTVSLAGASITFDGATVQRAAVKYAKAIRRTISLAKSVAEESQRVGRPYEIELSVDETAEPTTPAEHYIIADQLRRAGVKIISLAPRFVGDFEKGVDYKGDLAQLQATMRVHAAIAQEMGPYKISLHSGSDKLSMYPVLARVTDGRFHVKTAGTSYLEALRVAARYDQPLFREIIDFSRSCYDRDKATYHVSATLDSAPPTAEQTDPLQLEQHYLERWEDVPPGRGFTAPGRQILHCTFGSVMTAPNLGSAVRQLLEAHPAQYAEILQDHFARHLRALNAS